jgi:hypothetical protein
MLTPEVQADRLRLEERAGYKPYPMPPFALSAATPAATAPVPTTAPTSRLAQQITAARQSRKAGTPVAGMVPNAEQEDILATALQVAESDAEQRVLVVCAGAGTGKTATCKMLEQTLSGRGQYTAFSRPLVDEARGKFKKVRCSTQHGLAFGAVGKRYQHRLNSARMSSAQVARILGIEDQMFSLPGMGKPRSESCLDCAGADCPRCKGLGTISVPTDGIKVLKASFLAGQVLAATRRFCSSNDREIGRQHLRPIPGVDLPQKVIGEDGKPTGDVKENHANSDKVLDYLTPFCVKAWADLVSADGKLPFAHDVYVKIWAMGEGEDRPIIAADYLLVDEGQDTSEVMLGILAQQTHLTMVLVGDDCQQIYEWRGAVNAMAAFPSAPRCLLSQSYRFGQRVADVANAVLDTLDEPTDFKLRGNPALDSRVKPVEEPRCYLYRTNAGAIGRLMAAIEDGKHPHMVFGTEAARLQLVSFFNACIDLQAKPPRPTDNAELGCFSDWQEVQEYSTTDEGADLKLMVKLVDTFGAEEIRDALKNMPDEEDADLIISTAHRSKGREWDSVKLGPDFPLVNRMTDADRRLLYVAVTRAKLRLDITNCPPFCGGEEGFGENQRHVPGIKITWTPLEAIAQTAPGGGPPSLLEEEEADELVIAQTAPEIVFTWWNNNGHWCVRGPMGIKAGTKVVVSRKDGSKSSVVIGKEVKRFADAWIYSVS